MTQDEIIRSPLWHEQLVALAREAGFDPDYFDNIECSCNECNFLREPLERFAALVASHEREACAKVCDDIGGGMSHPYVAQNCAAAIRARGEK